MKEIKIEHVFQDGRKVDSMEGFVVPEGHPAYDVLRRIRESRDKE